MQKWNRCVFPHHTSPPLRIHATLIPPLQLTVREVCGARAASGSTLVEITVEHSSQWHKEDVTVTGIAFHPGQSRLWDTNTSGLDDNDDYDYDGEDGPEGENGMGGGDGNNNNNGPNDSVFMSAEGKSMQGGELLVRHYVGALHLVRHPNYHWYWVHMRHLLP